MWINRGKLMFNISVCMAAYNGEEYIRKQIETILFQLNFNDELIIVDDCSTDGTVEMIKSYLDPRIKLYRNEKNMGFIQSFFKAIRYAKNEYIFLSDQDDIWVEDKVLKVKKTIETSNTDVLIHNARVCTDDGIVLQSKRYHRGLGNNFFNRHLINNHNMGCLMAFKKNLINDLFPIPSLVESHDQWIGLVADYMGYKTIFLDEVLITWIRHDNNASSTYRRSWKKVIISRIKMMILYLLIRCRKYRRKL